MHRMPDLILQYLKERWKTLHPKELKEYFNPFG